MSNPARRTIVMAAALTVVACGSSEGARQAPQPDGAVDAGGDTGGGTGGKPAGGGRDGAGGKASTGGAAGKGSTAGAGGRASTGGAGGASGSGTGGARRDAGPDGGSESDASDAEASTGGSGAGGTTTDASMDGASIDGAPDGTATDSSRTCGAPLVVPSARAAAPAPVAHWSGDGNANDGVGGRNGTATSGVTYGAGQKNQAFVLDGTTGLVELPDGPVTAGLRTFSVALWVQVPSSDAADHKLFYEGTQLGEFRIGLGGAGVPAGPYFGINQAGNVWQYTASPCGVLGSQWTFIVGVRRATKIELWVDGVEWAETAVPDADLLSNSGFSHSAIGAYDRIGSPSSFFGGSVDEIRLYDVALSGAQIAKLYDDER